MTALFRVGILIVCCAMLTSSPCWAIGSIKVVLQDGDPAPNGNGVFVTASSAVNYLTLNNVGQLAFGARLNSTLGGFADDDAVFRHDGSVITEIDREGAATPNGDRFDSYFAYETVNSAGDVAFTVAASAADGSTYWGIYRRDENGLAEIVTEGAPAPDGNGTFGNIGLPFTLGRPLLTRSGAVVFSGSLVGTAGGNSDNMGIYRGDGESLSTIARRGGLTPDGVTRYAALGGYVANEHGQVVFDAQVSGWASASGVFRGDGAFVTQIARAGDPAPGAAGPFALFKMLAINDAGEAAFVGVLDQFVSTREAIYRGDGGTPKLIALTGQAAPGGNGSFQQFESPLINSHDQTLFFATISGAANGAHYGVFLADGGVITPLARQGATAPGGGKFDLRTDFLLNEVGQAAFYSEVNGTLGSIFFYDKRFGLLRAAGEGDALLGSTIDGIRFFGDSSGTTLIRDPYSSLNDRGQLAFAFTLKDGRGGVAVWSMPEPTTGACMAIFLGSLVAIRWRAPFKPSYASPQPSCARC